MPPIPVVTLQDIASVEFIERRPGCGKSVLHEDTCTQISVYRIEPGCAVPAHAHSRSDDLFFGIGGSVEISWPEHCTTLGPGAFCRMPAGTRHLVWNRNETNRAFFLLVHTRYAHFDFIEPR